MCLVILAGYALEAVSRKIVRLNLILLTFSLLLGFLWLILYSSSVWNPPKNYQYPHFMSTYLQLTICVLILNQLIKLYIIYLFLTQMQINELHPYSVSFGSRYLMMKLDVSTNESVNPLGTLLAPYFNIVID